MAEAIIAYVDELVDAVVDGIRTLAAALVGRASHPDNTDTDEASDES